MIAFAKIFDFVPGWVYAIAVALLAAGLFSEQRGHDQTKLALAQEQAEFALLRAEAEAETAAQAEKFRATEQELRDAQDRHDKEIEALRADRDAARVSGRVVADRVRDAARETAKLAGQACTDGASARVREAAATAARVLADLREESDEIAGILAKAADDAHFAGSACERRYNEVRAAINAP